MNFNTIEYKQVTNTWGVVAFFNKLILKGEKIMTNQKVDVPIKVTVVSEDIKKLIKDELNSEKQAGENCLEYFY